jgi:hypothetical protein
MGLRKGAPQIWLGKPRHDAASGGVTIPTVATSGVLGYFRVSVELPILMRNAVQELCAMSIARKLTDLWTRFFKKPPFRVRPVGRGGVLYTEGDHVLEISAEMGPQNTYVHTGSIQSWLPPYENEVITEEDKERIVNNMKSKLGELRWEFIYL